MSLETQNGNSNGNTNVELIAVTDIFVVKLVNMAFIFFMCISFFSCAELLSHDAILTKQTPHPL